MSRMNWSLGLAGALALAPLAVVHAQVVAPSANPAAIQAPPPPPDPSKVAAVNDAMAKADAAAAPVRGQGRGARGQGGPGGFGGGGRPGGGATGPGGQGAAAPAPAAISFTNTPVIPAPQAAPAPGGPGGRGGGRLGGQAGQPAAPAAPAVPEGIIVKTPPPPPVDPLAGLGGKVGAILDVTTKPHLLIVDDDHGVSDTRDLSIGDEYKEGWRLVAVAGTSFTMRKGKDTRQIAVTMGTASRQVPQDAGAAPGGGRGGPGGPGGGRGGGGFGFGNGAPGGRGGAGGAPGAAPQTLGVGANINSAQAAVIANQMLANLPPEVLAAAANDPRGAAILNALASGNIGDVQALITQAGGTGGVLARPIGAPGQ